MANQYIIGFRFTANDFSYAVLTGTKVAPEIIATAIKKVPVGYWPGLRLSWIKQELDELFKEYPPKYIVIKADEGRTKNAAAIERSRNEAIVYLSASDLGIGKICRDKRKISIAKDITGKGKTKYLKSLDTTVVKDYDNYNDKQQDSILCAWSELK